MLKPFGFREHVIHLAQRCTSPLIRAQELQLLFVRDSEGIYSSSMFCVIHLRFSIFSLWQSTGSASSGGVSYLVFFYLHADCKALVKGSKNAGSMSLYFQIKKMTSFELLILGLSFRLLRGSRIYNDSKDSDPRKVFKKIACRSAWPLQKYP